MIALMLMMVMEYQRRKSEAVSRDCVLIVAYESILAAIVYSAQVREKMSRGMNEIVLCSLDKIGTIE